MLGGRNGKEMKGKEGGNNASMIKLSLANTTDKKTPTDAWQCHQIARIFCAPEVQENRGWIGVCVCVKGSGIRLTTAGIP